MQRPESIENRWDILYRDYPEVYEAFTNTPYNPPVLDRLAQLFDLRGKRIADVGAGTGSSTFALARDARQVFGIEYERALLWVALDGAHPAVAERVAFLAGDALALPLADDSVDVVTAVTLALYPFDQYRAFIREGLRAARGPVIYIGIPPGWYGGELYSIIDDPEKEDDTVDRIFLQEFGFACRDIDTVQEYGTLDHIIATYGFIFGKRTIDYLRREQKTSIHWRFRVYWRE